MRLKLNAIIRIVISVLVLTPKMDFGIFLGISKIVIHLKPNDYILC